MRCLLAILAFPLGPNVTPAQDVLLPQHDAEIPVQMNAHSSNGGFMGCGGQVQQSIPQQPMHNPIQSAAVICNQIPPDQQGPLCAQLTQQQNHLFQQQHKMSEPTK